MEGKKEAECNVAVDVLNEIYSLAAMLLALINLPPAIRTLQLD